MAVEKVYKSDLSGEYVHKDAVTRLRVGKLDWRVEDYAVIDVGPGDHDKTVLDVIRAATGQDEGMVH